MHSQDLLSPLSSPKLIYRIYMYQIKERYTHFVCTITFTGLHISCHLSSGLHLRNLAYTSEGSLFGLWFYLSGCTLICWM